MNSMQTTFTFQTTSQKGEEKTEPTIQKLVIEACQAKPEPLNTIYSFVQKFRSDVANETIRARLYEAMDAGKIIRVTKGVYFARSGPAQILIVEGDAWNVLSKIEPDSIDAIITDPPFNMGTQQWLGKGTTRPHAFMDGKRTYEQHDIEEQWLREAFRVLNKSRTWNTINAEKKTKEEFPKGGAACAVMVPAFNRTTYPHITKLIELAQSIGFVFWGTITWDKGIIGMGYQCGRNQCMQILLFTAGERNGQLWDLGMPNFIEAKKLRRVCDIGATEHEAEKPAALFIQLLKALSQPGDVVLDPFAGRARWAKEALSMGRHVILGDIQEQWVNRIAEQDFAFAKNS